MTATELLKHQIDTVGAMLLRALSGLENYSPDTGWVGSAMDLAGQLTHLADAYQAVLTHAAGGKHDWGTFKFRGGTVSEMIAEMKEIRAAAVDKVLVDEEERLKMGSDYIVGHDNYHLGQIVTLHLTLDPAWDSYQIYG